MVLISTVAVAEVKVVVTFKPLHALVCGVMQGVAEPELLIKPGASVHGYALQPSELKALNRAGLVFWMGPSLETFLKKSLAQLKPNIQVFALEDTPIKRLIFRDSQCGYPHSHEPQIHEHTHAGLDPHFWLDPENAVVMVTAIADILSQYDLKNAEIYQKNSQQLKLRLKALDQDIQAQLQGVQDVPFMVFHDAYQYFEQRYGLKGVGAIALNPELPPSAQRLKKVRTLMVKEKVCCVFSEASFKPKTMEMLLQGTSIKSQMLDELGMDTPAGVEGYFILLDNLTRGFSSCLKP